MFPPLILNLSKYHNTEVIQLKETFPNITEKYDIRAN